MSQEQAITDGGRYQVKTEEGHTSLTIHDVVQQDCDKYTIVVRNTLCAHAAFASLAVGSEYWYPFVSAVRHTCT